MILLHLKYESGFLLCDKMNDDALAKGNVDIHEAIYLSNIPTLSEAERVRKLVKPEDSVLSYRKEDIQVIGFAVNTNQDTLKFVTDALWNRRNHLVAESKKLEWVMEKKSFDFDVERTLEGMLMETGRIDKALQLMKTL